MKALIAISLCAAVLMAAPQSGGVQQIDLAGPAAAGKLKAVNRTVSPAQGRAGAVHVSEAEGPGVVWIADTDFAEGEIAVEVRGRDVLQQSFVGVAFHRKDDTTYESVYLRPFKFRATDPVRHRHALQYMAVPDYDWPRLRQDFPDQFESAVDASISPTDWVPLRVVIAAQKVQVFAGQSTAHALDVRKLGQQERGMVGLWVGNNSDGDFASLRITPAGK